MGKMENRALSVSLLFPKTEVLSGLQHSPNLLYQFQGWLSSKGTRERRKEGEERRVGAAGLSSLCTSHRFLHLSERKPVIYPVLQSQESGAQEGHQAVTKPRSTAEPPLFLFFLVRKHPEVPFGADSALERSMANSQAPEETAVRAKDLSAFLKVLGWSTN